MTPGTTRRPLAVAVSAVLAITAGAALAVAPAATAAPAVVATATAAPTAYKVPPGVRVVSSGPSGFVGVTSNHNGDMLVSDYRWYRPDGTVTPLAGSAAASAVTPNILVSDIVTTVDSRRRVIELRDMSPAGAAPVVIDLDTLGSRYTYVATAGSAVLVQVAPVSGPNELHLLTKSDTTVSDRKVTGVPADLGMTISVHGAPGTALLRHHRTGADWAKSALLTVDLGTAAVTGTYPTPADGSGTYEAPALSPAKLAWWQGEKLVVTDRATGSATSIAVGTADGPKALGLLGDWVTYGRSTDVGGGTAGDPLLPFTARSLTGDRTVKLLDHASDLVPAPDDTLLVRGGTVEHGEGVYRIAVGTDGTPTAELLAGAAEPTSLAFASTSVKPVMDFDSEGSVYLYWTLSHDRFSAEVELIHKRTGQRYRYTRGSDRLNRAGFVWRGNFASAESDPGKAAFNGDYRWELTAKPDNGIGPDLHATGDFKVVRKPKAHDFNDNGSPDLLVRDRSGGLKRIDTVYDSEVEQIVPAEGATYVSGGWQSYQQIESVGDAAGTSAPDVIGRDSAGVLWLHQGTGSEAKPLADRVKIGPGWQVYHQLAGGSDLTGDGRADLVATDKAGDLYLYKGTGNATAPFAPRKKIGFGWGIYNQITAAGDIAGASGGDLVARDKAGVLWMYLGKGDGTFTSRIKVGAGWNEYTHLVAIGTPTLWGRASLLAYSPGSNTAYVYGSTGNWERPFQRRWSTGLSSDGTYNLFF